MSKNSGNCFIVLNPYTESGVIYGRNSYEEGEAYEVAYFPVAEKSSRKIFNNVEIEESAVYPIILSKLAEQWGGDSGANSKGVCVGIVWSKNDSTNFATDLLRLTLERSASAEEAVTVLGDLIEKCGPNEDYKSDIFKCSYVLCDSKSLWILNGIGKLWAAEIYEKGHKNVPNKFTIGTKIDKSSADLKVKAQDLGLWDGTGDFDFSKIFGNADDADDESNDWQNNVKLSEDGGFVEITMFETLRNTSSKELKCTSSHVSVLPTNGIPSHWLTATPNPNESVFKPFVFTINARISPLTQKLDSTSSVSLLQKLHSQRNWSAVGELLRKLELNCVEEVKTFLMDTKCTEIDSELDELMKDCVEAEVKFYR